MRRSFVLAVFLLASFSFSVFAQESFTRKVVDVPKTDSGTVVIDGLMDEAVWENAAEFNLITPTATEIFAYYYGRPELAEPDYDEYYGKLLWSKDTLYVFIHVNEMIDDSTDLTFNGPWGGDQIFLGLSNRLGMDLAGNYDGNPYAAPDGPYHFWVTGEELSLNGGNPTNIPDQYRRFEDDTLRTFNASDIARYAVKIDETEGTWDIELAIYHPNVNAQSSLGFNIGGSQSSTAWIAGLENPDEGGQDGYAYYTWQPNVPDNPFESPTGSLDPGQYTLLNTTYWALLNFDQEHVVIGVKEEPNVSGVPKTFALEQNYPNPFNPATTIKFTVPNMSPVNIHIYNTLGQKVATLISNQVFTPGTYSIQWNASKLSSGIYFYSLETNNARITKKMMLLK
ncbi:MAG TPA: T9SS type A sorting domain-containing protein [Ignavibacteriales bacterium]|nr:T9SS type A sorting domain-containing protein [Ignavibacteriales bacterium]